MREEWFEWYSGISSEEWRKERTGGFGSLSQTLIHIIDCELLWLKSLLKKNVVYPNREMASSLLDVMAYSNFTKARTMNFLENLAQEDYEKEIHLVNKKGISFSFTFSKVLRHMITHEIHHIGQLSIWAREMEKNPISSDLIHRTFIC